MSDVRYYSTVGGGVCAVDHDAVEFDVPVTFQQVDKGEYDKLLAVADEDRDAARARGIEADREQKAEDYKALVALKVPASLAARLTNHKEN